MDAAPTGTSPMSAEPSSVYAEFGLSPVVNASGIYTDLGGSCLHRLCGEQLQKLTTHGCPCRSCSTVLAALSPR